MTNKVTEMKVNAPIERKEGVANIFSSPDAFNSAYTMAKYLSGSTMVPKEFQGNVSNCIIALDMAQRTKMSPFMVMQNIYVVYGNPSWSSKFVAALINQSRRYAIPLQYEFNKDKTSCYVWAVDLDGNKVTGPTVTIDMAKAEGWYGKNGSKWQTMPEIMLGYRAVSFFGRKNCADLLMGIPTQDEMLDVGPTYNSAEEEIKAEANMAGEIGFDEQAQMDIPKTNIEEPIKVKQEQSDELAEFMEAPEF